MKKTTQLGLALAALLLYTVGFIVLNLIIATVLAADSAALLASYAVVSTVTVFVGYFFGFLGTGTVALIGNADAENRQSAVGRFGLWVLLMSLLSGLIAAGIFVGAGKEILLLFDPNNELDTNTIDTLLIIGASHSVVLLGSGTTGIFQGLLHFITLAALSFILGVLYVGSLVGFYFAGFRLLSYGWAFAISRSVYALMGVFVLYSFQRYQKYEMFKLSKLQIQDLGAIKQTFGLAIAGTSTRSIFTILRFGVSTILAVRLGVVTGAVYALMDTFSAVTYNVTRALAGILGLGLARLNGGMNKSNEVTAYEALNGFGKVGSRFAIAWGCAMTLYYAVLGEQVIIARANANETAAYEEVVTAPAYGLFVSMQLLHAITSVYEVLLISAERYFFVGLVTTVPFFVIYLPIALYGYLVEESFVLILAADLGYFVVRAVAVLVMWHGSTVQRWRQGFEPSRPRSGNGSCVDIVDCFLVWTLGSTTSQLWTIVQEIVKHWGDPDEKDEEQKGTIQADPVDL